jgi:hypothetical protein
MLRPASGSGEGAPVGESDGAGELADAPEGGGVLEVAHPLRAIRARVAATKIRAFTS